GRASPTPPEGVSRPRPSASRRFLETGRPDGTARRDRTAAAAPGVAWGSVRRPRRGLGGLGFFLAEQLRQLVGHGAAKLLRVNDGDGATVPARDVMADADGDELHRGDALYVRNHLAQVSLQRIA